MTSLFAFVEQVTQASFQIPKAGPSEKRVKSSYHFYIYEWIRLVG